MGIPSCKLCTCAFHNKTTLWLSVRFCCCLTATKKFFQFLVAFGANFVHVSYVVQNEMFVFFGGASRTIAPLALLLVGMAKTPASNAPTKGIADSMKFIPAHQLLVLMTSPFKVPFPPSLPRRRPVSCCHPNCNGRPHSGLSNPCASKWRAVLSRSMVLYAPNRCV